MLGGAIQLFPVVATSYDGVWLALQFPFSLIAVVIAGVLAFKKRARSASIAFAVCAILVACAGAFLEFQINGSWRLRSEKDWVGLYICLSPIGVAIAVLFFGKRPSPTDRES
jgi:hypothetical protein